MPFKYAAFSVMMPEFTIEEAAVLLKELKFDGVEWRVHSVPSVWPEKLDFWRGNRATLDIDTIADQAKSIRRVTDDLDLEVVGLGTYLGYKLLDDIERCMEAARIIGCGSIRVSTPSYDGSVDYHDLYEEAIDGYAKVEELARKYKVRANIEIHSGNICCSASLAYRFVSNFDPDFVGVILDPGGMIIGGYENWQLGIEILGPYLSHVHVKNSILKEIEESQETKRWRTAVVPMSEGFVSWSDVLTSLNKVGFKGWLALEDFAPGETKAKLSQDLGYLKEIGSRLVVS